MLNEKIPSIEYNLIYEILNDAKNKIKLSNTLQRIDSKQVISNTIAIKHRHFKLRKKVKSDALEKIVRRAAQKVEKNLNSNNDKNNETDANDEIVEYGMEHNSKIIKPKSFDTTDPKIADKIINLKPSKKIKTKVLNANQTFNIMENCYNNVPTVNLMKENLCLACFENECEVLNLPCFHLSFCRKCIGSEKFCLVCQLKIKNHILLGDA